MKFENRRVKTSLILSTPLTHLILPILLINSGCDFSPTALAGKGDRSSPFSATMGGSMDCQICDGTLGVCAPCSYSYNNTHGNDYSSANPSGNSSVCVSVSNDISHGNDGCPTPETLAKSILSVSLQKEGTLRITVSKLSDQSFPSPSMISFSSQDGGKLEFACTHFSTVPTDDVNDTLICKSASWVALTTDRNEGYDYQKIDWTGLKINTNEKCGSFTFSPVPFSYNYTNACKIPSHSSSAQFRIPILYVR